MSFLSTKNDPLFDTLTPRQIDLINTPNVQELITTFDLIPIKSPEVIRNENYSKRIDTWFTQFLDPNYIPPPEPTEKPRAMTGWKSVEGKTIDSPF